MLTQMTNIYQPNRTQLLLIFPLALHFINVNYIPSMYKKILFGYTFGNFAAIICNYVDYCIKDT